MTPQHELNKAMAARLKAMMSRLNMTQGQFAAHLGMTVYGLTKWLNGQRYPISTAIRLLDILDLVEEYAPKLHYQIVSEPVLPVVPVKHTRKAHNADAE